MVNSDLANPEGKKTSPEAIKELERRIDDIAKGLPLLKRFIFPSGSRGSALLHACRAVCRRAERRVVALQQSGHVNEHAKAYLNRLSSLLFVLARHVNALEKGTEEEWSS
jgi:cob(I)alamin adenosyltransferase